MSHDLRDPLQDLLSHVPAYVVAEPRAAWAAGARRRTRRRVGVVATVLVLVALGGAAVGVLPRALTLQPASGDHAVGGYPTRIDYPYWTRDLPDAPGPMAGVVERVSHQDGYDEPLGWYAVSPTGRLWHLPGSSNDFTAALSPDGTKLAYLDGRPDQGFEIRHLREGSTTSIDIGADPGSREPWLQYPQSPLFWSPDSSRLLVPAYSADSNRLSGVRALVLDDRGTTEVRQPRTRDAVMPVGWVSDSSLGWVAWHKAKGAVDAAMVLVTDDHGRLQRTIRLDVSRGVGDLSQWAGVVSSDGLTLAVGATGQEHRVGIRFYDLATGRLRATMPGVAHAAGICLPTWAAGTLQVPTENSDRDAVLRSANGSPTILADPRLEVGCSLWAADALTGDAHEGLGGLLLGDRTSWLAWHWREVTAGTLAGLALVGLLVVRRRRRVSSASD